MKFRKLGNTGLIVSELALGTMQFGGKMNMGTSVKRTRRGW
jgi:aryl-alcohol dehydrogenase-like predicted oxidoreductase